MPNVTVRNVPPDVHDVLVARAGRAGQSLQQYLLGVLERQAAVLTTDEWIEGVGRRLARGDGPTADPRAIVEVVREGREARDGRIVGR